MKSIYDISQEWLLVMEEIEDNGGEITSDLETKLEINEQNLTDKATAYAVMIERYKSESQMIDEEIKRLQAMSKIKKNAADRLKSNLANTLNFMTVEKLDLGSFKLSWRRSKQLEILDEEQVDEEFRVHSWRVDKKRIKEEIEAGAHIPWATIVENKNLQIR